jgi:lipopolysaccharide export system permease protein
VSVLFRSIARQYLFNAVALLALLFAFVVMIDVSVNLSRFSKAAAEVAGAGGSGSEKTGVGHAVATALAVADLWWPRLLQLFNYVIGVVLTGAMGFTFAQLVRNRELVAMMAGGISLFRAARPVLAVAGLCIVVQVANQELLIPRVAHLLSRDAGDAGRKRPEDFAVPLTADGFGRVWSADRFDPATGELRGVHVWERDTESGKALWRVSAESARVRGGVKGKAEAGGTGGGAATWVLTGARVSPISVSGGNRGGGGAGEMPAVAPAEIETDLDPTTILANHYAAYSATLSWRQIAGVLRVQTLKPELRDKLTRVAWGRVSGILCTLLSLVISMPFFLTREPQNMLLQSLKCAPVAVITLVGGTLGAAAPVPGLPPEVAVFIPVLVLAPLSVAAVTSVRT